MNNKIPKHIAIIMDGNGRWAINKNRPRVFGHHQGVKSVKRVTKYCAEIGVEYLTLYTFSKENWKRPINEVNSLMRLLVNTLKGEVKELHKNNVKLNFIGDLELFPDKVRNELLDAKEITKNNKGLKLILALGYSGRSEIILSIKKLFKDVFNKKLEMDTLDEKIFNKYLFTSNIPEPDLLIRTGNEIRVSNFMLWQIAYSEMFFCDKFWPDFDKDDLIEAIDFFKKANRRYGKVDI